MKKLLRVCLIVLILNLLVSCTTVSTLRKGEYSVRQANYALHLSLNSAVSKAFDRLCSQAKDMSFLPESYSVLELYKDEIPGMNTLIAQWNTSICKFLEINKDQLVSKVSDYSRDLILTDPVALVESSNSSASKIFREVYEKSIESIFFSTIQSSEILDISTCISQYNSWAKTQEAIHGIKTERLTVSDYSPFVAKVLVEKYLDLISIYEELYRTTPDPFADSTAAQVFGIN